MMQEMKEKTLSPEPVKNKEKEESPKVIKTFTELALQESAVKWSVGRKEKGSSLVRKSPPGNYPPPHLN